MSELEELHKEVESLRHENEKLRQECEERRELNEIQIQYRIDSHEAFCKDVARKLWAEYDDFKDSQNLEMTPMLGEIYREQLRHVFRILKQNDIDVESVKR